MPEESSSTKLPTKLSKSSRTRSFLNLISRVIPNKNRKPLFFVGGSNINPNHALLMDKFDALATKIDSEFLIIRKELKEMRDGRRDNQTSEIYISDDTPMCDPMESNYVQGYHDRNSRYSYSYPNHIPNHHYPYPQYF